MAGLLERPTTEAHEAPAPPAPAEPVARLCATCTAPLTSRQDWCLECGTAQPGRLGARPGWRAALAVLALTGVLAAGAVAASYAAMSSDARRESVAPPPVAAAPVVTPPPPAAAPPAPEPEPPVEVPDALDEAPVPEPPAPDPPAPAPAPAPAPSDSAGTDTGTGTGGDAEDEQPADAEPVALEADSATLYDPTGRADERVTDPELAIDGKPRTAWRAPAAADGSVRLGVVLSVEKARRIGALRLQANTPGFTVEVYGTRADAIPAALEDPAWKRLDSQGDVGVEERLDVGGTFRHVLVWVTTQPADTRVGIAELELLE